MSKVPANLVNVSGSFKNQYAKSMVPINPKPTNGYALLTSTLANTPSQMAALETYANKPHNTKMFVSTATTPEVRLALKEFCMLGLDIPYFNNICAKTDNDTLNKINIIEIIFIKSEPRLQ